MEEIIVLNSVNKYCKDNNQEVLHPLVSVVDLSKIPYRKKGKFKVNIGLYCILLKDVKCGDVRYGKHTYDYQEGTLMFLAPGQSVEVSIIEEHQPKGYGLIFHPDFLYGTSLGKTIQGYSFFGYNSYEALHISLKERAMILECFNMINNELKQNIDKHTKKLVSSYIELFLNYCNRFYDRQFIIREKVNQGVLQRFEDYLEDYYRSGKAKEYGVPSVANCADRLNLSTNYLGDLIRKEAGKSAQDYIQNKVIGIAKERILSDIHKSIAEISYELGFNYPQHFSRLFKNKIGMTPNEYKKNIAN